METLISNHGDHQPQLDRISVLRQELKDWEARFAAENSGRKATRDEIKRDSVVAAKYSEYQRLKKGKSTSGDGHAGCSAAVPSAVTTALPRKRSRDQSENLQAHPIPQYGAQTKLETPRKPRTHISKSVKPYAIDTFDDVRPTRLKPSPGQNKKKFEIHNEEDDEKMPPQPAFVGPTPQKNGHVLGLFDLLSPVAKMRTPTKPRVVLGVVTDGNSPRNTSKRDIVSNKSPMSDGRTMESEANTAKHSRSPQSASKRFLLDAFVTPSKRRRLNESVITPTTVTKTGSENHGGFVTPAFLRRHSSMQTLPAVAEDVDDEDHDGIHIGLGTMLNANATSPGRPGQTKWLRRRPAAPGLICSRSTGLGRSLSSMIADMRQAEDDKLDEDMEILLEMEGETSMTAVMTRRNHDQNIKLPHKGEIINWNTTDNHTICEESEVIHTEADLRLLGPDGASNSTDDDITGEGLGRDGQPLRVWKKKGMKRQTRKVLLRPTTRKSHNANEHTKIEQDNAEDDEHVNNPVDVIPETQFQDLPSYIEDDDDNDNDEEAALSDTESNHSTSTSTSSAYPSPRPTKPTKFTKSTKSTKTPPCAAPTIIPELPTTAAAAAKAKENVNAKENPIKKAVKKISATAHANFRMLKIRSAKGAKGVSGGGSGGGGRFFGKGRGRR